MTINFVKAGTVFDRIHPSINWQTMSYLFLVCLAWFSFSFIKDPLALGGALDIRDNSEFIIGETIAHTDAVFAHFPPGPMLSPGAAGGDIPYGPYFSQFGLQGLVIAGITKLVAPKADSDTVLAAAHTLVGSLLALTLSAFVLTIAFENGLVTGIILAGLLGLSNWIVAFSINAYWMEFTFFLPFVTVWVIYAILPPRRALLWAAVATCGEVAIKCLCGYEYVSNVAGSVAVPALYFGLMHHLPSKSLLRHLVILAVSGILGFSITLGIQLYQISAQPDQNGLKQFENEVVFRTLTNGEGISDAYDEVIVRTLEELHAPSSVIRTAVPYLHILRPILRYLRYQTKPAFGLSSSNSALSVPIGIFTIGTLLLAFALIVRKATFSHPQMAAISALLLSLVVSNSWCVLANGHMTHLQLNAIIFYIPFLPMAFVFLSRFFADKISHIVLQRNG